MDFTTALNTAACMVLDKDVQLVLVVRETATGKYQAMTPDEWRKFERAPDVVLTIGSSNTFGG